MLTHRRDEYYNDAARADQPHHECVRDWPPRLYFAAYLSQLHPHVHFYKGKKTMPLAAWILLNSVKVHENVADSFDLADVLNMSL
jgi:hypothetical protein